MRNSSKQRLSLATNATNVLSLVYFDLSLRDYDYRRNHDAVIRRSRFLSVPVACQILLQKYKE